MPPVEVSEIVPVTQTTQTAPVVEAPKVEVEVAKPVEAKVEAPKQDDFAKRIAIVAQKEQAATQKLTAAKALEKEYAPIKQVKDKAASGDAKAMLDWLGLGGITYEQLTKAVLAQGKPDPTAPIKENQTQLDARLKKIEDDKAAEVQAAAVERANTHLTAFKEEITQFTQAKTKAEDGSETPTYPYIVANDAAQLVYDVIATKFHETKASPKPIILSIEQASKAVEAHLEKLAAKQPGYVPKTQPNAASKETAPVTPKPIEGPNMGSTRDPVVTPVSRTLTNANATTHTRVATKPISDEERLKRSAALLKL